MIRPFTLVSALMFVASGLYLYQTKHQAQVLDRQIHRILEATDATRERAGVLRAEYALLNDPDRLADLAREHLPELKPTLPAQWSTMADLDRRLPPVGAPEPATAPVPRAEPAPIARAEPAPLVRAEPAPLVRAEPAQVPPAAAHPAASPMPAPAVMAAVPAVRPTSRPVAAAARPPEALPTPPAAFAAIHAAPVRPAAPLATLAPQVPSPVNLAHGNPPPTQAPQLIWGAPLPPAPASAQPHLARLLAAAPTVLLPRVSPPASLPGAPVYAAAARPAARQGPYAAPPATTAEAIARIARGGPVDPSTPMVASALGMARTMTLGTPVSPASAATLYPQGAQR